MWTRSACSRSSPAVSDEESPDCSRSAAVIAASADSSGAADGLRPVDDQARQRHVVVGEPLDEVRRLAQRVRLGCRDHDEGRAVGLEQRERLVRPLAEAAEEGVEGRDEGLHVAQHLRPEHLGQRVGHDREARPSSAWPDRGPGRAAAG